VIDGAAVNGSARIVDFVAHLTRRVQSVTSTTKPSR
jgi:hypothetical protein